MGDFSRDTFDKVKHYVGVRLQQGVPIVDADWNEQEDIRKYELQAFLKWFVGNGVPQGNDGFRILAAAGVNTFAIQGGNGVPEGAGRCLVEGWDILNQDTINYTAQPLYDNADLAAAWGVTKVEPLTTPPTNLPGRSDLVYVDVWEREVNASEDFHHLVNPAIGIETCVRLKREWAVRVAEGTTTLPPSLPGHAFYALATLKRIGGVATIPADAITDLRQTGLNLSALEAEIADARGIKANLGNRLDESLTKNGRLRHNVVGLNQIKFDLVNSGSEDLSGLQNRTISVERGAIFAPEKPRIYLPTLSLEKDPNLIQVARVKPEMVYQPRPVQGGGTDIFLRLTNELNIPVHVDWFVYTFGVN